MPVYPESPVDPGQAGSLIDRDFQYEFRGFLFGSGTPYQTELVDGILGLPAARPSDDENQEDHGEHTGVDLLGPRIIPVKMNILGTAFTIQELLDDAITAFQTSKRAAFVEYPWVTQRPGHELRFVWARARNPTFPSNFDTARGKAVGGVVFHATDPRFYSVVQTQTEITAIGGEPTAQGMVSMLGNFEDGSDPVVEIDGPCTNPRITNVDDFNRAIRLDVVIAQGETLVIDVKRKHVTLGGENMADVVRADNQWWVLVPGDNTIIYTRDTDPLPSELRVLHRNAWTSA